PIGILASGVLVSPSLCPAQPFHITFPQRVVGATGGCCTAGEEAFFETGPWMRTVNAGCLPDGGSGQAQQSTQLTSAFIGGSGLVIATAGPGSGCGIQATSSVLVPFDIQTPTQFRAILRLTSSGSLLASANLKVLPLLSVVRSWTSPANI